MRFIVRHARSGAYLGAFYSMLEAFDFMCESGNLEASITMEAEQR